MDDVKNPGLHALRRASRELSQDAAAKRRQARARLAALRRWSPTERTRRLTQALDTIQRALDADANATAFHKAGLIGLRVLLLGSNSGS